MKNWSSILRFGVTNLDDLLGRIDDTQPYGIANVNAGDTTTISIVGPNGVGKSILALHLASTYYQQAIKDLQNPIEEDRPSLPTVLYVSTDLSHAKAERVWLEFGLDLPDRENRRDRKELDASVPVERMQVPLSKLDPIEVDSDSDTVAKRIGLNLAAASEYSPPGFVDLQEFTTGDDWGFVTRLASILKPNEGGPPHLLIVDTVEGLQARGNVDAFGALRSRESRIEQLVRFVKNTAHLVLISEASRDLGMPAPEETIADAVLRLQTIDDHSYRKKAIEVVKTRGQAHVSGLHDFVFRTGGGSGVLPDWKDGNPDDPRIDVNNRCKGQPNDFLPKSLSYVAVFPSLNFRGRAAMRESPIGNSGDSSESPKAEFGIELLDEILQPLATNAGRRDEVLGEGFVSGKCGALIGNEGTYKSRLGRAFLSEMFSDENLFSVLLTTSSGSRAKILDYISFHHFDRDGLAIPSSEARRKLIDEFQPQRFLHRQLEVHYQSSAGLIHIVTSLVNEVERLAKILNIDNPKVRFVIDSWDSIKALYPAIKDDPICLPFICRYFRAKKVSACIMETRSGGFNDLAAPQGSGDLRLNTDVQIYTWQVPFYGEQRVALAASPAVNVQTSFAIRELVPRSRALNLGDHINGSIQHVDHESLYVDPHFEQYFGFETGSPKPVPLDVRLFGSSQSVVEYAKDIDKLFCELFESTDAGIVKTLDSNEYNHLREFADLQSNARLNFTLVFQVDEFWAESRSQLLNQNKYMTSKTVRGNGRVDEAADQFALFQPTVSEVEACVNDGRETRTIRQDFFEPVGHSYSKYDRSKFHFDRVPYSWDFGLMLLRKEEWIAAKNDRGSNQIVNEIWDDLISGDRGKISWKKFFQACVAVSGEMAERKRGPVFAFDVDLRVTESFTCMLMEVWASEIFRGTTVIDEAFLKHRHDGLHLGLDQLVEKYDHDLFRTFLLIGEVMFAPQFDRKDGLFVDRAAHENAIASRHWYSTASQVCKGENGDDWILAGLPGNYACRGDWFLAIANGSRSARLGQRAIDMLSSRRSNIERLRAGIGLPLRGVRGREKSFELATPINRMSSHILECKKVTYAELLKLGANEKDSEFSWLWRSTILNYDRHTRIFQRWTADLIYKWHVMVNSSEGFELYEQKGTDTYESRFKDFKEDCRQLIETLNSTSELR